MGGPGRARVPVPRRPGGRVVGAGGRRQLSGYSELARVAKVGALGAISLSAVALVHDLGRPERFVNMLRVFKPSSPMSVGSWLLAAYGPVAGAAAVSDVTGILPAAGTAATLGAGLLGPGIATYTAALICDTRCRAGTRATGRCRTSSRAPRPARRPASGCSRCRPAAAGPARTPGRPWRRGRTRRQAAAAARGWATWPSPTRPGRPARCCACRVPDRRRAGRRGARPPQPGRLRPGRRVAAGRLGADQVRRVRGGHGLGPGPEVHDRPAAPPP